LSALLAEAKAGGLKSATILDADGRVVATRRALGAEATAKVWAAYPKSDVATQSLLDTLNDAKVPVAVNQQTSKRQALFLAQFVLPLVLLANQFGLLFVLGRSGSARDLLLFSKL